MDLSGGGGHSILNDSGSLLSSRNNLQFKGTYSKDNSTNDATEIEVTRTMTAAQYALLSAEEKKGVINVTDESGIAFTADNVPYDNNRSVADMIDTINEVDTVKYVRGKYELLSGTTAQEYMLGFISALSTDSKDTQFDVIIARYGLHKFIGMIYAGKAYGAGLFYDFTGYIYYWRRDNNVDKFYNVTRTEIT